VFYAIYEYIGGKSLKRHAQTYLKQWIKSTHRKPLIIRGARQVGKSTLVRMFAKQLKIQLIEINFEEDYLHCLSSATVSLENLIIEIEGRFNVQLNSYTLLFLDEIQHTPKVIPLLRYFFEKRPDIPVIAAGSLLEFALEKADFSMPVGRVNFFYLSPMTFLEFLDALNEKIIVKHILNKDFNALHGNSAKLDNLVRKYYFIGGMPEAIKVYIESKDLNKVREVHRSIVQTYKSDFPKYNTSKSLVKIQDIFIKIPFHIGKKIKYSEISSYQSRDVRKVLNLLSKAGIITYCFHSQCSGFPIKAQIDEKTFKIYFLDVGLLNYLQGITINLIQNIDEKELVNKGIIAEQFAAQHLAYFENGFEPPELFYWLRDKKSNKAEIDFILQKEFTILPVEIKSGASGTFKSLFQFAYEKQIQLAYVFDMKLRNSNEKIVHDCIHHRPLKKPEAISLKLHRLHIGTIEALLFEPINPKFIDIPK